VGKWLLRKQHADKALFACLLFFISEMTKMVGNIDGVKPAVSITANKKYTFSLRARGHEHLRLIQDSFFLFTYDQPVNITTQTVKIPISTASRHSFVP